MSNYYRNRGRARTENTDPSLTDQSQARDTDINVIVSKMGISGTVPGAPNKPLYGDFTQLPGDLRSMIEHARGLDEHRSKLPKELRAMPIEELLQLTPEQLTKLIAPAPAPETTPNE